VRLCRVVRTARTIIDQHAARFVERYALRFSLACHGARHVRRLLVRVKLSCTMTVDFRDNAREDAVTLRELSDRTRGVRAAKVVLELSSWADYFEESDAHRIGRGGALLPRRSGDAFTERSSGAQIEVRDASRERRRTGCGSTPLRKLRIECRSRRMQCELPRADPPAREDTIDDGDELPPPPLKRRPRAAFEIIH
jgi:hypothetical protein